MTRTANRILYNNLVSRTEPKGPTVKPESNATSLPRVVAQVVCSRIHHMIGAGGFFIFC